MDQTAVTGGGHAVGWVGSGQEVFLTFVPESGDSTLFYLPNSSGTLSISVAGLADGRIAITYLTRDDPEGGDYQISVRFLDVASLNWSEAAVTVGAGASGEFVPFLESTARHDGRLMIAWADGENFVGRIINPDGSHDSDEPRDAGRRPGGGRLRPRRRHFGVERRAGHLHRHL
ncbi:hypothetical protein ACIKTA_15515 [Hansschlegelia beijingensis]